MSAGQYVAIAIGWGLASVFAGLLLAFRRNTWARKAHNLAAKSDIALPGPLVPKVARFLRDCWLFGLVLPSQKEPASLPTVASWLPLKPDLTLHGLRHRHQTWLDDLGIRYVPQADGDVDEGAGRIWPARLEPPLAPVTNHGVEPRARARTKS